MLALNYRTAVPRIVATKLLGMLRPGMYVGPMSPLQLEEVPEPVLRADDWLILRTRLCGICGSDYKQVFLNASADNPMSALCSFPHVLGHEIVGEVIEAGARSGRSQGERVVVNPWLSCGPRGIDPPCAYCAEGQFQLCRNFRHGSLAPAVHLGNCSTVGGGFAPRVAVHGSQAIPIPDTVSWEQAVIADPFSVALHSVYANPPDGEALVYGCGTLGLLTIAVLRHRFPDVRVFAVGQHPHQKALAEQFGASLVLDSRDRESLIRRTVEACSGELLEPWRGLPWSMDGVSVVYDTVAAPQTVEAGLRLVRTRGRLVIVGVEIPRRFEWTPIYFKEIAVVGSNAFSVETDLEEGRRPRHAMEHYWDYLAEGFDATAIITHRYPLTAYREAFAACWDQAGNRAVKVVFEE